MNEQRESAGPGLNIPGDIVYVREVRPEELTEEARAAAPAGKLYAIHDSSGARLALAADRGLAFSLARQHDRRPVSVH
jgi:hypothetical protein